MRKSKSAVLFLPLALAACAHTVSTPLANDVVKITTSAAQVCGHTGAEKVAINNAAVTTLKRGYDKFIVVGGRYANNTRVVGHTPIDTNTYGNTSIYGNTAYSGYTSTTTGGVPIYGGSHDQSMIIKMFKNGDPNGVRAIDARKFLGSDWQNEVRKGGAKTC